MVACLFMSRYNIETSKDVASEFVTCVMKVSTFPSWSNSWLRRRNTSCRSHQRRDPKLSTKRLMSESTDDGGFIKRPESSCLPPTPASTASTLASPPAQPSSTRLISSREESQLIGILDDQIATILSRFIRRSP